MDSHNGYSLFNRIGLHCDVVDIQHSGIDIGLWIALRQCFVLCYNKLLIREKRKESSIWTKESAILLLFVLRLFCLRDFYCVLNYIYERAYRCIRTSSQPHSTDDCYCRNSNGELLLWLFLYDLDKRKTEDMSNRPKYIIQTRLFYIIIFIIKFLTLYFWFWFC